MGVYLLNISMSGIKCLKKSITLDFYGKTVNKNFKPDEYRVKGIYGENGAGKSAIITGVAIYKSLLLRDNYLRESKVQEKLHELINKVSKNLKISCEFVITGADKKSIFHHEIELVQDQNESFVIAHELLQLKFNNSKNMYKTVYETRDGMLMGVSYLGEKEEQDIRNKSMNLLSRQTLISLIIAKSSDLKDTEDGDLYDICTMVGIFGWILATHFDKEDEHELYFQQLRIEQLKGKDAEEKAYIDELEKMMLISTNKPRSIPRKFEKSFIKYTEQLTGFIKVFKRDLKSIDIKKSEDGDFLKCELNLNYGEYAVNEEFESTGIKKLIELYNSLALASMGGIVFIDELDSNINDVYLCRLIEYFMYYGEGQLCFTSHNIDPMMVLKDNKKSIDFLTGENTIVPWTKNGNYTPDGSYRNGMIKNIPFNIEPSDFIQIFAGE
ncbi:MAG: ATP-binding protein [Butyrivibrio sp.]|nr:ATP-binding protein [Butyrivibrio sp.]